MTTNAITADPRFAPNAQAFLTCMTCDTAYPPGTERCSNCHTQLSSVRRCPQCQRLLSARHEQCIYCATSFLVEHQTANAKEEIVAIRPDTTQARHNQRRAAMFGVAIFVAIFLFGTLLMHLRSRNKGAPVLATAYTNQSVALKLQPSPAAGTALTVSSGTVLSIVASATDDQGRRWFEIAHESKTLFIPISDVSPPKANQKEGGEQILRYWIIGMTDPDQSAETVQAVNFFCAKYDAPASCEELRWVAADRLRSLSVGSRESHALEVRAREMYERIISANGKRATEAAAALATMRDSPHPKSPTFGRAVTEATGTEGSRQYSLIDRAEVHVQVQDLRGAVVGTSLTAPIAREVVLNGQVAVPRNATCSLTVISLDPNAGRALIKLTGIYMRGKHYSISAQPRFVTNSGALVVFQLDAPLLVGH